MPGELRLEPTTKAADRVERYPCTPGGCRLGAVDVQAKVLNVPMRPGIRPAPATNQGGTRLRAGPGPALAMQMRRHQPLHDDCVDRSVAARPTAVQARGESVRRCRRKLSCTFDSGGHGTRTRNPFRGTTFPVWPLAIRLPSENQAGVRPTCGSVANTWRIGKFGQASRTWR